MIKPTEIEHARFLVKGKQVGLLRSDSSFGIDCTYVYDCDTCPYYLESNCYADLYLYKQTIEITGLDLDSSDKQIQTKYPEAYL